jgi:hypothetical protein
MNLLLINQYWFSSEWREAGHKVLSVGRYPYLDVEIPVGVTNIHEILSQYCGGFEPDRIVIFDDSSPLTIFGLDDLDIPQFFYSVDTHHHYERHREFIGAVDEMWTAQSDYIPHLEALGGKVGWMPLWASVEYEGSIHKKIDACFVGTLNPLLNPKRVEFFNRLKRRSPITVTTGSFQTIFPTARMIVNQTVKQDLNFRVFEAMMSGSLLLTEKIGNRLFQLFSDSVHLVTYAPDDDLEAAEKIAYYIDHKEEARQIGEAGREEIMRAHLPRHRAQTLLLAISSLIRKRGVNRHLSMMTNHIFLALRLRDLAEKKMRLEALAAGALALERAMVNCEKITLHQATLAAIGCIEYDLLQGSTIGSKLLNKAAEVWKDCSILQLVHIWQLGRVGQTEDALRFAESTFGGRKEDVCDKASEVADMILNMYGCQGIAR